MLAKFVSIGTALVSVPLSLHYLGTERYGMWLTISSVVTMLNFTDLGLGNGILSGVARAHGQEDNAALRSIIASGALALCLIASAMLLLLSAASFFPASWYRIFNVDSSLARGEAAPALAVFVTLFLLNMPLSVVQKVQVGLQAGFVTSLWQCLGSVLGLAGVLLAIALQAGLPWLVVAFVGAPMLANVANNLHFFGFQRRDLMPRLRDTSIVTMRGLAATGVLFLLLQVAGALAFAADNFVIAQFRGAAAVPEFAVPERLFSLIPAVLTMALSPLWPAYGEAIARGDRTWVVRTFRRSLILAVGIGLVMATAFVVLGRPILAAWVGPAIQPSLLLLLAFGVWKVIEGGGNALAMFYNGAGLLGLQAALGVCMAVCAVLLKVLLIGRLGLPGLLVATIVSYCVFIVVPSILVVPRMLRRM